MKRRTLFVAAVCIAFAASGCTIKKDFTLNLERDFVVNQSDNPSYSQTGDVRATDFSSDFETYKGDLDAVEVQQASYIVTYWTGPSTQTTNASVMIGDLSGGTPVLLSSVSNVNLMSVAAREQTLSLNSAGSQKLNDLIKNSPYGARFYFTGTVNQVPVIFTTKVKVQLKVTYKKQIP